MNGGISGLNELRKHSFCSYGPFAKFSGINGYYYHQQRNDHKEKWKTDRRKIILVIDISAGHRFESSKKTKSRRLPEWDKAGIPFSS